MPYNYGKEEEQSRKLFVGGISLDTTDEGMKEYFGKYGNITDCVVIREQGTSRSKGFGFVTFETEEEADKCMGERPHVLDGRTIDAKRAVSREESAKPGAHVQVKKIFVGGVKAGCDESILREYFGKFGSIISVDIPLDRDTKQPKGYGFVTFNDFDVTDKLVAKRHHDISGFQCEVKKALSKDEMERAKQQLVSRPPRSGGGGSGNSGRGGGGGRGGPRGRGRGSRGGYNSGGGDYGDGYGTYSGGYNDGYGSGYGGGSSGYGPMKGQYGQRSGGPYGGGYGSGGGGYGSGGGSYGGYGNGSGGYGSGGYSNNNYNGSNTGYDAYGGNNGYDAYGQGSNYYGNGGGGGSNY